MADAISVPLWRKDVMQRALEMLQAAYDQDVDVYLHLDRKGIELAIQELNILVWSCSGEYNARPVEPKMAARLQPVILIARRAITK